MRWLLTSLLGFAALVVTEAAQAVCEGGVPALSNPSTKECSRDGMKCAYWEPPTNDPGTKYPLVIFLHGAGGSGTADFIGHLNDGWTCQLQELLNSRTTYPAYIMAPRAPSQNIGAGRFVDWDWGTSDATYDVTTLPESQSLITARAMLQALQTQYANIDPERIYVVGVSMGGYGTWDLISRAPELFAAGVPAEGGGSPQAAPKLKNMAIWSEHDDQDSVSAIGDQQTFAALARAGSRPYYTEAVSGSHGLGMGLSASMGFVPWMFAQRRGVPSTPAPWLVFAPEGGELSGPTVTVTLSATPQSNSIYYTTDGSIPNGITQVGTRYAGPFTLSASAVVIAAAHHNVEGTDMNVFHAAPFKVGDSPLVLPFMPSVGGTGGAAASGGASNPNPFPPSTGGNSAAAGGASSGSGGSKQGTSGGAAGTPVAKPTAEASGGCAVASADQSGNSLLHFGIASIALAAFAVRRRERSSRS